MLIHQWFKGKLLPTLKRAWQRQSEKSKEESRIVLWNDDLTNPQHPMNVGQREMNDYNDRRAREALFDHLQDSQRFQEHQRRQDY